VRQPSVASTPAAAAPLVGLRACALAVTSTGLAALAHTVAGGALPATGPVVAGLLLVLLAARVAARRERGAVAVLLGVAVSQAGLHLAFLGGHAHMGRPTAAAVDAAPAALTMTAGHLVAALLLVAWLRWGEACLWAAARRLAAAALRLVRPVVLVPARALLAVPAQARRAPRPARLLPPAVRRRGPPLAVRLGLAPPPHLPLPLHLPMS